MSVLATPEALTVLAGFALLVVIWTAYRMIHDPGAHRRPRHDPGDLYAPVTGPGEPYPEDAADYTIPGMFLSAPVTEVIIPVKPVNGTPPWPITPRAEELLHLPEPGPPPIVADITRGLGATLHDYDPLAAFKTALLAAVEPPDQGAADRVYALMGGDS